jgi:hypothetical protein
MSKINFNNVTISRCEYELDIIKAMHNNIEVAYIRLEDGNLDIGSDVYVLTDEEKNIITKKVDRFIDTEIIEEDQEEQYNSYDDMYGINNAMFI